jgi:hypothetical protein
MNYLLLRLSLDERRAKNARLSMAPQQTRETPTVHLRGKTLFAAHEPAAQECGFG